MIGIATLWLLAAPLDRTASGTAWQPDAAPMYMGHARAGDWTLMWMVDAFAFSIDDESRRGDEDLGALGMAMGMARHALGGGTFEARAMLSPDPVTIGACGYPDVLQTGEACAALGALHDRQHPHDLVSELALTWVRPLTADLSLQVYGGPAGEPALGPVAYPHRLSAMANPFAPIGHHWLDSTHISFGVATLGVMGRRWKVEGSAFDGREPDADRFDVDPAPLDSFSGRVWLLPDDRWSLQVSGGRLDDPEQQGADETRLTASATYHLPFGRRSYWDTTLAWGQNREARATNAVLLESTVDLDEADVLFGRWEGVQKTAADLVAPGDPERAFLLAKAQIGYTRQFPSGGTLLGLGFTAWQGLVPDDLAPLYGDRSPVGVAVFASLRPAPMGPMAPMHMH